MDLYTFILYLIGVASLPIVMICFFLRWEFNKVRQESTRLRLAINQAKHDFGTKGSGYVGEQIGELGIEGLLAELGVPKMFMPVAKGFVDSLLKDPEKLKALAERVGIKLPGEEKNGSTTPGFM